MAASVSVRPENASWVSPYIIVSNLDEAIDFYQKAFGFELLQKSAGTDGSTWHAEFRYKDQMLMFGQAGAYGGNTKSPKASGIESPMNLYLYTENVDDFYKKTLAAGAKSLSVPEIMFWGDKMCRLQDPDGYVWCFATHVAPCKDRP